MAIMRFDPFRDLAVLQDRMNRRSTWAPAVDIYEVDGELVLKAELPGMQREDIAVNIENNTLTIRGEKQAKETENAGEVLYQGIAARAFERRFQLADHVYVRGASLENGLLHVDLEREVPEAMKPRQIPIGGAKPKVVEAKASKAA